MNDPGQFEAPPASEREQRARSLLAKHWVYADPMFYEGQFDLLWNCYLRAPDVDFSVHLGNFLTLEKAVNELLKVELDG